MVAGVEPLLRIYGNAEDGRGMRGQEYGIQLQLMEDPAIAGMLGLADQDNFSMVTANGELTNYGYAMMYRDVAPEASFVFYEDIANAYLNLKIAQNYR